MKNILVPTDFSNCAQYATLIAKYLAKRSGATVNFLHLISVPMDWVSLGDAQGSKYPEITKKVNSVNHQLDTMVREAEDEGVNSRKFLGFNENFFDVIDHLKDYDSDFIIMGSHGASGLREILIGSNAQKVVRASTVPVLAVKKPLQKESFSKVVFASDFEGNINEPYGSIVDFTRLLGAELHLLFINTPFNFTETPTINKKMGHYAEKYSKVVAGTHIFNCYNVEDGITEFCHANQIDALALITHSRKGISRIFSASLTESVINHLDLPVLSVSLGY